MSRGSILIGGDSWGRGEWDGKGNNTHTGLQFYLEEIGYKVDNVSKAAKSNTFTTARLAEALTRNYDYIFWFKTDPLRCLRPYPEDIFNKNVTVDKLKLLCSELSDKTYSFLNNLDRKIYCIGGNFSLQPAIEQYSNLVPIIPSAIKLCYPDFTLPELWFSDWIDVITAEYVDLEKFVSIKKTQDLLHSKEMAEYFKPDGLHTNRKGHKLIFDTLNKQLKLTQ